MSEAVVDGAPTAGEPSLERSIGPFQLFAYTLGGMLGAGAMAGLGAGGGSAGWGVRCYGVDAVGMRVVLSRTGVEGNVMCRGGRVTYFDEVAVLEMKCRCQL